MDLAAITTTAGATMTTTTKATPIPTCYTQTPSPPHIECSSSSSGAGSAKESRRILLLCLRGIAAFCWAASRRTLERMLLAYLQSVIDNSSWRSLFTGLTGSGSRGVPTLACADALAADEARAFRDKEGGGAGGGACVNQKKVFWSYLRGM